MRRILIRTLVVLMLLLIPLGLQPDHAGRAADATALRYRYQLGERFAFAVRETSLTRYTPPGQKQTTLQESSTMKVGVTVEHVNADQSVILRERFANVVLTANGSVHH